MVSIGAGQVGFQKCLDIALAGLEAQIGERGWMGGKQESMHLGGLPHHVHLYLNTSSYLLLSMSQLTFSWKQTWIFTFFFFFPLLCLGVKGNVQGNLFKVITKDDTHYYIQASSKAERSEWIEAIKQLTWQDLKGVAPGFLPPTGWHRQDFLENGGVLRLLTFIFCTVLEWAWWSSSDYSQQWCYLFPSPLSR